MDGMGWSVAASIMRTSLVTDQHLSQKQYSKLGRNVKDNICLLAEILANGGVISDPLPNPEGNHPSKGGGGASNWKGMEGRTYLAP